MVQILLSKDSQEHPPKVSAPATVRKAWARSHHFSIVHGLLYLNLRKQDPERHKDEPRRLYIPTPLKNTILPEAPDAAVGGHFRAAKTYMVVRQRFFWPGMLARDLARRLTAPIGLACPHRPRLPPSASPAPMATRRAQ
jgi:hypothetical protein